MVLHEDFGVAKFVSLIFSGRGILCFIGGLEWSKSLGWAAIPSPNLQHTADVKSFSPSEASSASCCLAQFFKFSFTSLPAWIMRWSSSGPTRKYDKKHKFKACLDVRKHLKNDLGGALVPCLHGAIDKLFSVRCLHVLLVPGIEGLPSICLVLEDAQQVLVAEGINGLAGPWSAKSVGQSIGLAVLALY